MASDTPTPTLYTVHGTAIDTAVPHRPEALPMRATAHTRRLPTIPMLVYHTVDDWTTRSSSAEARRSTPAHPCRALGLTPERCEAEVPLAVCIAVVVGGHGRVATAHQIAPWSRGSDLLSRTAVGAAFRSTSVGDLAHFQSDMGIAQRSRSCGECTQLFGCSRPWLWPGRDVDVPNPRAGRAAESQRFH